MVKPLFTGVCTALVTPFINNEINYPLLDRLIQRQIDAHIPAVVLAGTTGESPVLSDMEKLALFKRGKEYAISPEQIKLLFIKKQPGRRTGL